MENLSIDAIFTEVIRYIFGPADPRIIISHKLADIDIDKEYHLIQQKRSSLSAGLRQCVVDAWISKYSRTTRGPKLTYQDMLICFMLSKQLRLKALGITIKYITDQDIAEIRTWSKWTCFRVWQALKQAIYNRHVDGLGAGTCIWCIRYLNRRSFSKGCKFCGYGKRHGICDSIINSDTYTKICIRVPLDIRRQFPGTWGVFQSEWYQQLVTYIESNRR